MYDYKTVSGEAIASFRIKVQQLCMDGWEPLGGMAVAVYPDGPVYHQSLKKRVSLFQRVKIKMIKWQVRQATKRLKRMLPPIWILK